MKTLLTLLVVYLLLGVVWSQDINFREVFNASQVCKDVVKPQVELKVEEVVDDVCMYGCVPGPKICHDHVEVKCENRTEKTCKTTVENKCIKQHYTSCSKREEKACITIDVTKDITVKDEIWQTIPVKQCAKEWQNDVWVPIPPCVTVRKSIKKTVDKIISTIVPQTKCETVNKTETYNHTKEVCWDVPKINCEDITITKCVKVDAGVKCEDGGEKSDEHCMKRHLQKLTPYWKDVTINTCGPNYQYFKDVDFGDHLG